MPIIKEDPQLHWSCTVRGHDHKLNYVHTLVQKGTGMKAFIYECPTGVYRWMIVEGRTTLPETLRFKRPRWGWGRGI